MKHLFLLVLFSISLYAANAQMLKEWTQQKQTQVKYLLQQIAALKVYAASAQKGYAIARDGLNLIQDIKDGDYNLHLDQLNSLKAINENVKGYAKVASIIAIQANMGKAYRNTFNQLIRGNQLQKGELDYYKSVCTQLLQQSTDHLEILNELLRYNYFEMTDDERLKRIDAMYADIVDQAAFLQGFNNEMKALGMLRLKEKEDVKTMQLFYDVK